MEKKSYLEIVFRLTIKICHAAKMFEIAIYYYNYC